MDVVTYDKNLEKIYDEFGRVALVPLLCAAKFVGVDKRTLQRAKGFPVKKVRGRYYVGTVQLARWLSVS